MPPPWSSTFLADFPSFCTLIKPSFVQPLSLCSQSFLWLKHSFFRSLHDWLLPVGHSGPSSNIIFSEIPSLPTQLKKFPSNIHLITPFSLYHTFLFKFLLSVSLQGTYAHETRDLHMFSSVILSQGWFLPIPLPRFIWQRLETFWALTLGRSYRHLVSRNQECC